jgi:cobalt/nickel transport system ATP-binding protein
MGGRLNKPVFKLENVCFEYAESVPALQGISLDVHEGESIALLGANASGKSTLLQLMDGLCFASSGSIKAFGTTLSEQSVEAPPFMHLFRQNVGFLFQNPDAQLFSSTVWEELAFGPVQMGLPKEDIERRVRDVLLMVGIEKLAKRAPQTLSGGEKKKVALASILTCAPKVILLDEPGAGLDPRTQEWLAEFILRLKASGVTLVLASHDLGLVAEVSDRTLVLSEDHRLLFDGSTLLALADQELLLSANLIRPRRFPASCCKE